MKLFALFLALLFLPAAHASDTEGNEYGLYPLPSTPAQPDYITAAQLALGIEPQAVEPQTTVQIEWANTSTGDLPSRSHSSVPEPPVMLLIGSVVFFKIAHRLKQRCKVFDYYSR